MSKRRVVKPRYERLPNVTPISSANEEDLSDLIRNIVREEVQKVLPRIAICTDDGPDGLESIIGEEIDEAASNDLYMTAENYGLYAANDVVIPENCIRKVLALAKHNQTLEKVIITEAKDFEWDKELKVPASIATIHSGKVDIWITNSSCRTQIIRTGKCIAGMTEIEEELISSLNKNTDKVEVKHQAHLVS
ncbi:hypothetical protein AVEN_139522-1 [Araneus ventricosus]|uniref:Uncharacterized protein n=1 Tax=Araneus ventricosus TaxID=182803 RepID=A0A4Y2TN43_ARAVE|nr:hypothetical protein AVEN_139522-1 [Araneus ventricosus]